MDNLRYGNELFQGDDLSGVEEAGKNDSLFTDPWERENLNLKSLISSTILKVKILKTQIPFDLRHRIAECCFLGVR